ncbi:DUF2840 domain-containing protein [Cupriavidus pauculus]|uniref:Transposase n=1 Tax=Cupriavidus pauculus TaxID=82633 RepID=A0A2N5C6U8_9BURK|nr:DUF2840 domain-containing protein [Cupriavidus pauculus]PLP97900.1 transposase [Cupriavidus pauculus]
MHARRLTNGEGALPSASVAESPDPPGSSLTRVSLACIEGRLDLYLRFGAPVQILRLDDWRRVAMFAQDAIFARVSWQAGQLCGSRWQLMVMKSCRQGDAMQRMSGVRPGAQLLLHAEGEKSVRAVLLAIDAIEAQGIRPADVSPVYWCTLGNRLGARLPLPAYTAARHAAWLAGEGKC